MRGNGQLLTSIQEKLVESVNLAMHQYHKLVILVEDNEKKRNLLISDFAKFHGIDPINLNLHLSSRLLEKSPKERTSTLLEQLRDLIGKDSPLIVLNHCEILFDQSLKNDPLKLLENISRNRTILVAWPGHYQNGSLIYATPDHPEYRCYTTPEIPIISEQ